MQFYNILWGGALKIEVRRGRRAGALIKYKFLYNVFNGTSVGIRVTTCVKIGKKSTGKKKRVNERQIQIRRQNYARTIYGSALHYCTKFEHYTREWLVVRVREVTIMFPVELY